MIIASVYENEKKTDLKNIFEEYMECGANILIAPTFLAETNDEKKKIIEITAEAASDLVFVAGEIRAKDESKPYREYTENIKKEVAFLSENGVSMIFLNGFKTLAGAKYAYCAAKEICELPVCIGLSFEKNGKLSDGCEPLNAQLVLQALGADAIGCVFDDEMENVTETLTVMSNFTTVPMFVLPNMSEYLTAEDFAEYIPNLVNLKCAMIGTAKGSGEKSLIEISKALWQFNPHMPDFETVNAVCSRKEYVFMDFKDNIIGENKNILEIKIDDENTDVEHLLEIVNSNDSGPVCFNVKDPEILRKLLYEYVGRPAVISDEYGEIAAKEVGAVILGQKNTQE